MRYFLYRLFRKHRSKRGLNDNFKLVKFAILHIILLLIFLKYLNMSVYVNNKYQLVLGFLILINYLLGFILQTYWKFKHMDSSVVYDAPNMMHAITYLFFTVIIIILIEAFIYTLSVVINANIGLLLFGLWFLYFLFMPYLVIKK